MEKGYWTKQKISEHTPEFVNKLWPNDNVIGCADATYLYSQKSQTNYQYQKQTCCVYKERNLQKEHVICTADGYIISADGPYFADGHNTDAIILDNILHDDDHQIHEIMKTRSDDNEKTTYTIMTDRGYKTCAKHDRYKIALPFSVTLEDEEIENEDCKQTKKRRKPLTSNEALHSRFEHISSIVHPVNALFSYTDKIRLKLYPSFSTKNIHLEVLYSKQHVYIQ